MYCKKNRPPTPFREIHLTCVKIYFYCYRSHSPLSARLFYGLWVLLVWSCDVLRISVKCPQQNNGFMKKTLFYTINKTQDIWQLIDSFKRATNIIVKTATNARMWPPLNAMRTISYIIITSSTHISRLDLLYKLQGRIIPIKSSVVSVRGPRGRASIILNSGSRLGVQSWE